VSSDLLLKTTDVKGLRGTDTIPFMKSGYFFASLEHAVKLSFQHPRALATVVATSTV